MAELKPCPFCGDNQQLKYVELSNGLHYIECARCGAAPHRLGAWNRETAVKYWNSVSRWIPVENALPDHYDEILFCERDRTIHKGYMYWDGTFIENHVKFRKSDIVAWMPMPDAYEPSEKE